MSYSKLISVKRQVTKKIVCVIGLLNIRLYCDRLYFLCLYENTLLANSNKKENSKNILQLNFSRRDLSYFQSSGLFISYPDGCFTVSGRREFLNLYSYFSNCTNPSALLAKSLEYLFGGKKI